MKIGFIGLGHMGMNLVQNLMDHGHTVVAWNRSLEPREVAKGKGVTVVEHIKEMKEQLDAKRIVFLMVSAGAAVDAILFNSGDDSLINVLESGDIVIDGANSFYKDSQRRAEKLAEKGIVLLDVGISGGVEGARSGASVMVGGNKDAFLAAEPVFKSIAVTDGYDYFGESGAGHYVKMVHNAIEYGMMQSIAEGINLLEASPFKQDYNNLLRVWNHGSIIESRLVGFLQKSLEKNTNIPSLNSEIGALGTGMWAVRESLEKGVPFDSIAHAVFARYQSRHTGDFAFKLIQAMRAQFGEHTSAERELISTVEENDPTA